MFNIAIKTKEADSENACLCNQIFIFQWYLKLFFPIWGLFEENKNKTVSAIRAFS